MGRERAEHVPGNALAGLLNERGERGSVALVKDDRLGLLVAVAVVGGEVLSETISFKMRQPGSVHSVLIA